MTKNKEEREKLRDSGERGYEKDESYVDGKQ